MLLILPRSSSQWVRGCVTCRYGTTIPSLFTASWQPALVSACICCRHMLHDRNHHKPFKLDGLQRLFHRRATHMITSLTTVCGSRTLTWRTDAWQWHHTSGFSNCKPIWSRVDSLRRLCIDYDFLMMTYTILHRGMGCDFLSCMCLGQHAELKQPESPRSGIYICETGSFQAKFTVD